MGVTSGLSLWAHMHAVSIVQRALCLPALRMCRSAGATTTKFLESLPFSPVAIEVVSPGMNTTIQASP